MNETNERQVYVVMCVYLDGDIRFDSAFLREEKALDWADACMSDAFGEPVVDTRVIALKLRD